MSVSLRVSDSYYPMGDSSFFYAFFSTVSYRLEPDGWGTRFPVLMNELYQGSVDPESLLNLKTELTRIKTEFLALKPDKIVWDIEDLTVKPPWADEISTDITSLGNYFVTSEGRDLFDVLFIAINNAIYRKSQLLVE